MTQDHSETGTPTASDEQAAEESAGGEELLPPAASDWDPEVDAYRISRA